MIAVNNTDLNINLDRDLVDFVMAGTRRWHGERIRKSQKPSLFLDGIYGIDWIFISSSSCKSCQSCQKQSVQLTAHANCLRWGGGAATFRLVKKRYLFL
ncbi:MAG: hypothetical protein DRP42_03735 [Tenericutes bacterium]|nr:MAG: hypothetical protein DRP42_03735 [Mycoplasmatota bacterium]